MPAIRQTSIQQVEHMIRFIEKNPTASGPNLNQSYAGKTNSHRAWNTLMHQLNALEGNKKTGENWRKYWKDLKHRTKLKIIEYQKFKRSPENFARPIPPLDPMQRKIWRILLREKNQENICTSDTVDNEIDDDSLLSKELGEDSENVIETVVVDVKTCRDAQMEELELQNTSFDFFIVDSERDSLSDHNQSTQETVSMPEEESHNFVKIEEYEVNEEEEVATKKQYVKRKLRRTPKDHNQSTHETVSIPEEESHNYVKIEEEEVNEEEEVAPKKQYVKSELHRTPKETHNEEFEDENEKPDQETEITKLQKELLKKQILVEEHKLFQIKLQNELLKKQLLEESEKYSHNHMKRLLEKEELQKRNLDNYAD